jgi:hypothetical protein
LREPNAVAAKDLIVLHHSGREPFHWKMEGEPTPIIHIPIEIPGGIGRQVWERKWISGHLHIYELLEIKSPNGSRGRPNG